jgi:hypothetical protein
MTTIHLESVALAGPTAKGSRARERAGLLDAAPVGCSEGVLELEEKSDEYKGCRRSGRWPTCGARVRYRRPGRDTQKTGGVGEVGA